MTYADDGDDHDNENHSRDCTESQSYDSFISSLP